MSLKSCHCCTHWKKLDHRTILWDFAPRPEYECEIWGIVAKQLPDPQAVIDAAFVSPEAKAEAMVQQCPSYTAIAYFYGPEEQQSP